MNNAVQTNRDLRNGRYVDTKFEKPCTCGHTLGVHTADRKGNIQPCMADGCECNVFTKLKRTR